MTVVVTADPTKGIKLDAAVIAAPFREEIRKRVQELKQQGIDAPLLVGLLANRDPAAKKYAEWTGKACQADGLRYELRELDDPLDVETALIDANDDPRVHGIIVYYPIFAGASGTLGVLGETFSGQSRDDYLRDTVSFKCDVEGLCHTYRTNLYRNVRFLDYPRNEQKCVLPCTALSVVKILEHCPGVYDRSKPVGKQLEGKTITVVNRSEIVGRPLAAMLANDGATVYSVDINSIFLLSGNGQRMHHATGETPETCVRNSSVVVTGVPTKDYRLPTDWIQPFTTVVNVASYKNVDEDELLKIPGVVYVPLVGKVTVAMLERNLMRLFDQFHHPQHFRYLPTMLPQPQQVQPQPQQPWYGHSLQLYTSIGITVLLAMELMRAKR